MGSTQNSDLRREELIRKYPNLATSHFRFTSPDDRGYNCFAYAGDDTRRNWHPSAYGGLYWPGGETDVRTLEAYVTGYGHLGYSPTDSAELEDGIEKIAIYARQDGPSHAALQLTNGYWTSKLGHREDIEHELHGLEGERYGRVVAILARPRDAQGVLPLNDHRRPGSASAKPK